MQASAKIGTHESGIIGRIIPLLLASFRIPQPTEKKLGSASKKAFRNMHANFVMDFATAYVNFSFSARDFNLMTREES